ncbi:MAG: hypothetical protein HETSPECPRED_009459 [Heterodermia speciosa]|uniref:F-box domain-containing protein n=1 Tax=Heterodermia speciosa TaxID=116794 RepID=A0A8H3EVD0_9LECA|nr:MAG: hypothetical protein HETSPECPRED_009459 [Heterodermia speciosa]
MLSSPGIFSPILNAHNDAADEAPCSAGQVYDPDLGGYRPQRFSLASTGTSISWNPFDINPGSPRSSTSSYASIASLSSIYSTGQTPPPFLNGSSKHSSYTTQQRLRSTAPPTPVFQRLPPAIYDCILVQLRAFHEEASSLSCQTCCLRDLASLALVSRKWDKAVRPRLYEKIHIVGNDAPLQLKKYKMKSGVRLKLLRRTLRERRVLAQYVVEFKPPRLHPDTELQGKDIIDRVASIVMCCPNLERLVGFYPIYNHEFDRLTYALSTRRKLKEHMWIMGENSAITRRSLKQLPPGLMDYEQVDSFLRYHQSWTSLTTLFLHSHNSGILERDVFSTVLHQLPSLQHLSISNFDIDDFDDIILQDLPPLQSLRLQDLQGVTYRGLSDFARSPSSQSVRSLSLVHLDIAYLSTITNLLLYLQSLTRFTLVQESSPLTEPDELIFQPIVASRTLSYLHWDILRPGPANANLASSIRANGFPALRTIRAPSDHDGLLQSLCRPRATIVLPSDKYSKAYRLAAAASTTSPSRTPLSLNLFEARKAAQQRIDERKKQVSFRVTVEEEGEVIEYYDFEDFVGTIGSRITYSLEPDVAGSDDALIDVGDLMGGAREASPRDGCTGLWNAANPSGKKWWCHTERWRYRVEDVGRFF